MTQLATRHEAHDERASEQPPQHEAHSRRCGAHASIDKNGGVTSAFRRLPVPVGTNPAVKCCRNKPVSRGPIEWNVTLNFTVRDYAPWPAACEALCERTAGCKFFSHSVRWAQCILCSACVPEIMLGDDTFASFERATEDPAVMFTGVLA